MITRSATAAIPTITQTMADILVSLIAYALLMVFGRLFSFNVGSQTEVDERFMGLKVS